ncbi:MAG TPA: hypothetical protein VNZ64_25000 [Candidatus Acidoferrum sp.]|jgi:hypothetical protein|nr:hypothetical protein [Candidatus Acidoferrum sp.]
MNTEAQLLAQVKSLLKPLHRDSDIRNAAVFSWRYIIDRYGGQADESVFVSLIQTDMVLARQGTTLSAPELLDEWKKAKWIQYSPDGKRIQITEAGIERLKQWETENREFRAIGAHDKIKSLLHNVSILDEENGVKIENLVARAEMIIIQIFDKSSPHLTALRQIKWHGLPYDSIRRRDVGGPFQRAKEEFTNLCNRMLEDLGPEPNSMPLKERLVAGEPARNLRKIKNIIGKSTVTGIHDPYTTTGSLETILKLADMETKFGPSLRILGTPSPLSKSTEKKSLIGLLKDINTERAANWEVRTYVQASKPHRRFLVLDDGSVVTCGMSLNHIDKDEVLDREPAGSENAKYDSQFFEGKWKTGAIL